MANAKLSTKINIEIDVSGDGDKYDILHKICTILREESVIKRINDEVPNVTVTSIQTGFIKVNVEYEEK